MSDAAISALVKFRKNRETKHNEREYYKKVYRQEKYKNLTAKELYGKILSKNKHYDVDDYNERQLKQLCKYFTGEMQDNFSLNKGLCLMGGVGIGKTEMMRLFASNQVQSYAIRECLEISKEFMSLGADSQEKYYEPIKTGVPENFYGQDSLGICFDDLGTENSVKHFGNDSNVMADIILTRYSHKKLNKQMTHFTTNLTMDEIEQKYGSRVKDRIKEMFNIVIFDGNAPSRRK